MRLSSLLSCGRACRSSCCGGTRQHAGIDPAVWGAGRVEGAAAGGVRYVPAKGGLQKAQDSRIRGTEAGEVLKVPEDEAGGLFVVVCSEEDNDDDDEGGDIPDQDAARQPIQQVRAIDVHRGAAEGDQVAEEHRMPALNDVGRKRQVRLPEDEIRADEVVRRAHG